jgi:hypothetical protein
MVDQWPRKAATGGRTPGDSHADARSTAVDDYDIHLAEAGHAGEQYLHGMNNNDYMARSAYDRASRTREPEASSPILSVIRWPGGKPWFLCLCRLDTGMRSPRAAIGFLLHAMDMDLAPLGWRRTLSMPGLSGTVGEEIEALRRVAGDRAVKLIRYEPDSLIERIVAGWPQRFDARRAESLGFTAERSFDEIIQVYIEDELGGKLPV